jgi:hypothetical protein
MLPHFGQNSISITNGIEFFGVKLPYKDIAELSSA